MLLVEWPVWLDKENMKKSSEAMAAATILSGFSGIVVAAAAGCSGFAGSLGGREVVPWNSNQ